MRNLAVTGLAVVAVLMMAGAGMLACAEEAAQRPDLTGQWRLDPKRSDTMKPPGDAQQRGSRGGGFGGGPPGGGGGGGFGGGPPGGGGGGGFGGGPPGGGGGGGFGGGPPGGGGGGGFGGGPPDEDQNNSARSSTRAAPPRPLPDLMHVTESDQLISFEDSTGAVLQEITLTASESEKDTLVHAPGAQVFTGRWKDAKLEAKPSGRGGMKLTQAITFEGDTVLIIRTKMTGSGPMPANEFKRFYRRVKGD
jgi:hypothetical protein